MNEIKKMKRYLATTCLMTLLSGAVYAEEGALPADGMLSYLDRIGAEISWSQRIEATNMTIFKEVEIIRYGKRITVKDLRTDGSMVSLDSVGVKHLDGGDGLIFIQSLDLDDKLAFMEVFDHVDAAPYSGEPNAQGHDQTSEVIADTDIPDEHFGSDCGDLQGDGELTYGWSARSVRLIGDMDSLPEMMTRSEEVRFGTIREVSVIERRGEECVSSTHMAFSGMDIVAIDGARASITSGSVSSKSSSNMSYDDHEGETLIILNQASLANADAVVSASIGSIHHHRVVDEDMSVLLCELIWPHGEMSSAKMLERTLNTASSGQLKASGIWISVPYFLPPYMIDIMGLQSLEEVTGDVSIEGSLEGGIANLTSNIDLPGLVEGGLLAKFSLPTTLEVTLPGFIADKLPIPGELLDMKVHEFSFSLNDQGIGGVISAMTGLKPSEHVDKHMDLLQARVEAKLPSFVVEKITEARGVLVDLVEKGGKVSMTPVEPQTIMSIAMQSMMNPGGLSGTMGMSVEINE